MRLLRAMQKSGVKPDGVTVRTLLKSVLQFSAAAEARGDNSAEVCVWSALCWLCC